MESGSIGAMSSSGWRMLYAVLHRSRHALHFRLVEDAGDDRAAGSHGCLNLLLDDAEFFWQWADYGVGVYCHY